MTVSHFVSMSCQYIYSGGGGRTFILVGLVIFVGCPIFLVLCDDCLGESIVTISKLDELYFKVGV
jgi:hypothetical protein